MQIRLATEDDFPEINEIFRQVVASEDTYVFPANSDSEVARDYLLSFGFKSFVAIDDGCVVGVYKLRANNIGLGSHVANASFMVHPKAQGKGVGRLLGEHCLEEARRDGFKAMQFNFVVSSNKPAVELWKKLGFDVVGTIPLAFQHPQLGLVDTYVMHRLL